MNKTFLTLSVILSVSLIRSADGCLAKQEIEVIEPPTQPGQQDAFDETKTILNDLIGKPFAEDAIKKIRGGGLAVDEASMLNCEFDGRCCWHNIDGGRDDLEWVVAHQDPDVDNARDLFGTELVPAARFAAVGSKQTYSLTYGFLASCPIICQHDTGTISFKQWRTNSVTIDVCALPLDSKNFTFCQTITEKEPEITITMPPQNDPFTIVIVASEFTDWPGGLAAIDSIKYSANICGSPTSAVTTPEDTDPTDPTDGFTDPPGPTSNNFQFDSICNAVDCSWDTGRVVRSCAFEPIENNDRLGTASRSFLAHEGRLGNWAAGVIKSPEPGESYGGVQLPPGTVGGLKTKPFDTDTNVDVEFNFFESSMDVDLKVCYDSVSDPNQCQMISQRSVKPSDRRWRSAQFVIPRGNRRRLFFIAQNHGNQNAAVGIGQMVVLSNGQNRVDCSRKTVDEQSGKNKSPFGEYEEDNGVNS